MAGTRAAKKRRTRKLGETPAKETPQDGVVEDGKIFWKQGPWIKAEDGLSNRMSYALNFIRYCESKHNRAATNLAFKHTALATEKNEPNALSNIKAQIHKLCALGYVEGSVDELDGQTKYSAVK